LILFARYKDVVLVLMRRSCGGLGDILWEILSCRLWRCPVLEMFVWNFSWDVFWNFLKKTLLDPLKGP
jgi:hypothetical protein